MREVEKASKKRHVKKPANLNLALGNNLPPARGGPGGFVFGRPLGVNPPPGRGLFVPPAGAF